MADVIEMIQLSPTMEEGVLVAWLKNEGDAVAAGDLIAEVETDKATMEMESFFDGVLLKVLVSPGTAAPVGTPLAIVGEAGEDVEAALAEIEKRAAEKDAAEKDAAEKDAAEKNAADKDAAEANAPAKADAPDAPSVAPSAPAPAPAARAGGDGTRRLRASPLARRLAAERGYQLADITGSGPSGRIVRRDVEAHVPRATGASMFGAPRIEASRQPLSQMRKAIARNLVSAWQAPAFMLTRDIVMDRVMATRAELNDELKAREAGVKLSVNDFVIRACALALADVPTMNSAFVDGELHLYGAADIGFAVALDGGLITPVVREAERKSVAEIATEAKDLAKRARAKKLKPEEFTGASFSVSNLGMFGIDHFTAVLNPPAAGILAVGATRKEPVVGPDDTLTVGLRMSVTLTCDHRAVDGAVGATFLQRFAHYMERPSLLIA